MSTEPRHARTASGHVGATGGEEARFAVLAADWHLRGYTDRPAVLYDWRTGENHTLSPAGGYVARSCDGATDFASPFFLPAHRATLDLMIEKGMAVECRQGAPLDPRQQMRTVANRYLPFANWAVTGRCNLDCRHCYMEAPSGRYGELPTETMLGLVDQFERAGVQRVHLTGGEPLLRPDFWVLVAALAARRIGIHQISTNGMLVDDEALARLQDLDVRPVMHFSYDGVGTHDGMRGSDGTEDRVLDAVRLAAAAGFHVSVTSSLDRETRAGIVAAPDLLADAGVRSWHITAPLPVGRWKGASTTPTLAEQAEVAEALVTSWKRLGRPYLLTVCGMFAGAPGDYLPPQEPVHRCSPEDLHCAALLNDVAYVMPDGRLIPCPRFIDTPLHEAMPSLLEVELGVAWDDPTVRGPFDVTKASILEHNPECAVCPEFGECGAGCWAMAYRATGDLLGRDPDACTLWRSPYRRRMEELAAAG